LTVVDIFGFFASLGEDIDAGGEAITRVLGELLDVKKPANATETDDADVDGLHFRHFRPFRGQAGVEPGPGRHMSIRTGQRYTGSACCQAISTCVRGAWSRTGFRGCRWGRAGWGRQEAGREAGPRAGEQ